MIRREFITILGGVAAAVPVMARAQQPERMKHVGVLMSAAMDDPDDQHRRAAFQQGLKQLGWIESGNGYTSDPRLSWSSLYRIDGTLYGAIA